MSSQDLFDIKSSHEDSDDSDKTEHVSLLNNTCDLDVLSEIDIEEAQELLTSWNTPKNVLKLFQSKYN